MGKSEELPNIFREITAMLGFASSAQPTALIILLARGDKRIQAKGIKAALRLNRDLLE